MARKVEDRGIERCGGPMEPQTETSKTEGSPPFFDSVKINIAPWECLGIFPVKKIVGKVEITPTD